jgi:hypothetical protein
VVQRYAIKTDSWDVIKVTPAYREHLDALSAGVIPYYGDEEFLLLGGVHVTPKALVDVMSELTIPKSFTYPTSNDFSFEKDINDCFDSEDEEEIQKGPENSNDDQSLYCEKATEKVEGGYALVQRLLLKDSFSSKAMFYMSSIPKDLLDTNIDEVIRHSDIDNMELEKGYPRRFIGMLAKSALHIFDTRTRKFVLCDKRLAQALLQNQD